jgi:hypothetical protein
MSCRWNLLRRTSLRRPLLCSRRSLHLRYVQWDCPKQLLHTQFLGPRPLRRRVLRNESRGEHVLPWQIQSLHRDRGGLRMIIVPVDAGQEATPGEMVRVAPLNMVSSREREAGSLFPCPEPLS